MVERGWKAHVLGEAPNKFTDAKTAVTSLRVNNHAFQSVCKLLRRCESRLRASSVCLQNADKDKPVSDQWLPPFVIVDKEDKPVGTIEVSPPPLQEVAYSQYVQRNKLLQHMAWRSPSCPSSISS